MRYESARDDATMDPRASVVIVDDHPGFRHGLRAIIEQQAEYRVVAEASCGYEAVQVAAQHRPDLILLDYQLPGVTGLVITPILARHSPNSRIVFLSVYDDEAYRSDAMDAGAAAYVTKDQDFSALLDTMTSVITGSLPGVASVAQRSNLADPATVSLRKRHQQHAIARDDGMLLEALTAREITVLDCVVQGHRYRTCAEKLFLSEATVKNNVTTILSKWGLTNRVHLFLLAISLGWVRIGATRTGHRVSRSSSS